MVCFIARSCLTLSGSMDCSPPGSSVHGISQARILEWVGISFSRDLPNSGIKPTSLLHLLHWQAYSLPPAATWEAPRHNLAHQSLMLWEVCISLSSEPFSSLVCEDLLNVFLFLMVLSICVKCSSWTNTAPVSSENLLHMQILEPHPRLPESETWKGPSNLCFN